jgi:hypothetical protein
MFKSFTAIALSGVVSAIDEPTFKFMQYVSQFNKSYASVDEFNARLALFTERDQFVTEWNADETNTHRVGHNRLSDYTEQELNNLNGIKADTIPPMKQVAKQTNV